MPTTIDPSIALAIPVSRLRGKLAELKITHTEFARIAQLNRIFCGRVLAGSVRPGRVVIARINAAIAVLHLAESEAA